MAAGGACRPEHGSRTRTNQPTLAALPRRPTSRAFHAPIGFTPSTHAIVNPFPHFTGLSGQRLRWELADERSDIQRMPAACSRSRSATASVSARKPSDPQQAHLARSGRRVSAAARAQSRYAISASRAQGADAVGTGDDQGTGCDPPTGVGAANSNVPADATGARSWRDPSIVSKLGTDRKPAGRRGRTELLVQRLRTRPRGCARETLADDAIVGAPPRFPRRWPRARSPRTPARGTDARRRSSRFPARLRSPGSRDSPPG